MKFKKIIIKMFVVVIFLFFVPLSLALLIGDANGDGKIDGLDFVTVLIHFGQTTTQGPSAGDVNSDGVVNNTDLNTVISGINNPPMPTSSPGPSGWTKVSPGGNTMCARGTPYAFWYKRGTSNNLMVYFQGGGGCFDAVSCAPGANFSDRITDIPVPNGGVGIFDTTNSQNPVANYNIVYVPYCTGDFDIGSHIQQYTPPTGSPYTLYHYGFVNSNAALNFTYSQFSSPSRVLVAGCSAGGIGSAFLAPYVMQHYGNIPASMLDDSGSLTTPGSIFPVPPQWGASQNLPTFVPGVSSFTNVMQIVPYSIDVASFFGQKNFAQVNHALDQVESTDSGLTPTLFNQILTSNLNSIESQSSNFHDYMIPGNSHCITTTSGFYSTSVSGVPLTSWVSSLINGSVSTVR